MWLNLWADSGKGTGIFEMIEAVLEQMRRYTDLPRITSHQDVRDYLGTHSCLLILDSFDYVSDSKNVVDLLDRLPISSKALVTTQRLVGLLGQERVIELLGLTQRDAGRLIVRHAHRVGAKVTRSEVATLARLTKGVPLTIQTAAALARGHPASDLEGALSATSSVEQLFRTLYRRLSRKALDLLQGIAVLEGGVDERAIPVISRVHGWRSTLNELMRLNLVRSNGLEQERYRLHRTVRRIALGDIDASRRHLIQDRACQGT
jgi:hypothetical protein